jgi:Tfp pilus assembly protein PilF
MSKKVIAPFIALIVSLAAAHASVPIIVSGGACRRVTMSLSNKAEKQLEIGDVAGAKRNVDAALHADPTFWPALYQRAEIFAWQEHYQLAVADCNEALRQ